MRSRSTGHIMVGSTSATLGAVLLVLGVARPAFLTDEFLETPAWMLSITAGLVLSLAGVMVLIFTFRPEDEPEPEIPAHVAFNSRMTIPDVVPHLISTAPAVAAMQTLASAPAPVARLPAPAPAPQQRVAPINADMQKIDVEIRDLTKKINKAGVMLATGQLSQQGYLAYVEDLKRQRGKLEGIRVRHELRT